MMKARSLAGLLLIVFTIGCATAQDAKVRGTTAANAGHFADAYRYWLPLAEAGDPEVQEAIALLLESENDLGLAVPARERQQ
jgi:hypothetical protein